MNRDPIENICGYPIFLGKSYTISTKTADTSSASSNSGITVDIYGSNGIVLGTLLDDPALDEHQQNA